jgi:hypothetical protein
LNTGKKITLLLLLTMVPALSNNTLVPAQTGSTPSQADNIPSLFESTKVPQWVKDLRRWEIVAFGSIPFTMLTATFAMDMYRWQNANGMDFSDEGRRYAPWPMKSAGAIVMERREQEMVFIIAASLSVGIALTDQIIVQIKRHRARKKAEALPVGTIIITQKPWAEEEVDAQDNADEDTVPIVPESPSPEQF